MKPISVLLFLAFALVSCAQSPKKTTSAANTVSQNIVFDTAWTTKVEKTKAEWRASLTPDQYAITREQGTEPSFSSPLYKNHDKGIFYCVSCQNPLFSSQTKFESGTGWPSFFKSLSTKSLDVSADDSHGMSRDEVTCQRCHAHLGHVFNDGPAPTGLRYCMDGIALTFQAKQIEKGTAAATNLQKAIFAGGCFWGVEYYFQNATGVTRTSVGYTGGKIQNPTYEQVCSHKSGHYEALEVTFDPSKTSYETLAKLFFEIHDPTQATGQGNDLGQQYQSVVFYLDSSQKEITERLIQTLKDKGFNVATQLKPATRFWDAEEYHQKHYEKNGGTPYCHSRVKRF